MSERLKAGASAYAARIAELDYNDLSEDLATLRRWWHEILADPKATTVEGWAAAQIEPVHDRLLARLRELEPDEKAHARFVTDTTLSEPDAEADAWLIGLDYHCAAIGTAVRIERRGDTLFASAEVSGRGWSEERLVEELRRLAAGEGGVVASVFDRPEQVAVLRAAGFRVVPLDKRKVGERIDLINAALQRNRLRVARHCPRLIAQLKAAVRAEEPHFRLNTYARGQDVDAVTALGYGLRAFEGTEGLAESAPHGKEYMPIRPSGKVLGETVAPDDILPYILPFVVRSDIVRLTGGVVNRGATEGDIEVYVEELTWPDLLRIICFRLFRGLPAPLAERLHFLADHRGGPFTCNIPLGDLVFVPKAEFVKVAMALTEALRSATKETLAECEASLAEDWVRPDRMFFLQKPWRGARAGERQTIAAFLGLFAEHDFPMLVSKKFDGNTFTVFKQGDRVRIFSDDGLENEGLGPLRERIKRLPQSSLVLAGELEVWVDGVHYPREATRAVCAGARDDLLEHLVFNVFEVLYWNGRDIHNEQATKRWSFAQDLDADQQTDGVPKPAALLNRVPQYPVRSVEELEARTRELSDRPGSEGVVVKRGPWPLRRKSASNAHVKYHKAGWVRAVVLERHETAGGTYTYTYGLRAGDEDPAGEVRRVGGESYVTVGKTFATSLKLRPGTVVVVEFETLNAIYDHDADTLGVTCWVPELLETAEGDTVHTLREAIAEAKRRGVLREKWVKDRTTFYDKRKMEGDHDAPVAEAVDPYLEYPKHGTPTTVMRHAHFRGASVHFDVRRQVGDRLVGWTENVQRGGTIKDPVTTIPEARRIVEGYDPKHGNAFLKPMVAASEGRQIVVERKAPEPVAWKEYQGVEEPGGVGATREHAGVFLILDEGRTEWGAQKAHYHEYFDAGGAIFNGRYVVRLLKNVWGEEKTGKGSFVWMAWYADDPVPYVLSRRAVNEGWMPPDGQSALPEVVRKLIPPEYRYWQESGAAAKEMRDALVRERIVTRRTLGFNERGELVAAKRLSEALTARRGLYLVPRHAHLVADGEKDVVIKKRAIALPEPMYLITREHGKSVALGVITLGEPVEVDRAEFDRLRPRHGITDEEREHWWGDRKRLWAYEVKSFRAFPKPLPYQAKAGVQTIQLDVVPATEQCAAVEGANAGGAIPFNLLERSWKGQTVIRGGRTGHEWVILFPSGSRGYRALVLSQSPTDNPAVLATSDTWDDEFWNFEGEIKAGHPHNPHKEIPVRQVIVDKGTIELIRDDADVLEVRFVGKKLRGRWEFRKEGVTWKGTRK